MILILLALMATQVRGQAVDLNCADNATCIDGLVKDFVKYLRANRAVKLFDTLTVEPLSRRQGRSIENPFSKFFEKHAFTIDFLDYAFRFSQPEHRSDAVELEVFHERATDAPETSEKSILNQDDDSEELDNKTSKPMRRRHKKKVMQALIPMMFGMKSAGAVMLGLAVVTALTLKAYLASKLALAVTLGMALKKLYESYSYGIGLQNNPYMYSQYPIDFPSASQSHAYSIGGMAPHFPSPDLYNPTALASHSHGHEMLQHQDSAAQQSQGSPTLHLANTTRATERWDGKSRLIQLLQPIIDGLKSVVRPIVNVFSISGTYRDMKSNAEETPSREETENVEAVTDGSKFRQILVAQPRNVMRRKMIDNKRDLRNKPKKHYQVNFDLEKLKYTKDYKDYIKIKKYKHNYPFTSYYPRIRHYVNPDVYLRRPDFYNFTTVNTNITKEDGSIADFQSYFERNSSDSLDAQYSFNASSAWRPIVVLQNSNSSLVQRHRTKRSLDLRGLHSEFYFRNKSLKIENRMLFDYMFSGGHKESLLKHKEYGPPKYYLITYDVVMFWLQLMEDFVNMNESIYKHLFTSSSKDLKKKDNKKKNKKKKDSKKKDVKKKKGSIHKS